MDNNLLPAPKVILFDWHGTLVDTHDAMYHAIEDLLPQLDELDLLSHLIPEAEARTAEDEKLLRFIRIFRRLPPKILAERRVTRTDIFDALFGDKEAVLNRAHTAYNTCYARHYGEVRPFQDGIHDYLTYLRARGIGTGILTNRSREFLQHEMAQLEGGRWTELFDVIICGDEADRYKPAPHGLNQAVAALDQAADEHVWYVGDSVTDIVTGRTAGVTSIFYNGALWEQNWFEQMFAQAEQARYKPHAIVDDFDALLNLVDSSLASSTPSAERPPHLPPRQLPTPHHQPDWHPAVVRLTAPKAIVLDWHATLVDTLDAMYQAVDDLLGELKTMGLHEQLVDPASCDAEENRKLLEYVRAHQKLHPKILHDRKISRTDIFEILFGDNQAAKQQAHAAFTQHYRKYYGSAQPFELCVGDVLEGLKNIGLPLGVITNRDREFYVDELASVDNNRWAAFFDTTVCGDDTVRRKPHIDQLIKAAEDLGMPLTPAFWYVGDSTTDVIAAKSAGITSVFFNGAQWDQPWLNRIFPGTAEKPHQPDVVVNDFSELWALVLACRRRHTGSS